MRDELRHAHIKPSGKKSPCLSLSHNSRRIKGGPYFFFSSFYFSCRVAGPSPLETLLKESLDVPSLGVDADSDHIKILRS
jgi:hypothetical protein